MTLRSDVVASLINLLKDHEAHLQLSVYDPVSEVVSHFKPRQSFFSPIFNFFLLKIKTLADGKPLIFSRDTLQVLEAHPFYHNVRVYRRFLLK